MRPVMNLVRFTDVGREKKCWEQELKDVSEASLARAAKKGGHLMSPNIDIEFDSPTSGYIVAGVRSVGEFEICSPIPTA